MAKLKQILGCILLNTCCTELHAQFPVEISVGHSAYYYQHAFGGRFHAGNPLGFFHTSSVMIPYDKNRDNEIMSQSYLTYAMNSHWTSGVGSIFTPLNRVRPSVFFQYFQKGETTSVLFYPRMDVWSDPNLELMGFFEYRSVKNSLINLYARFQYMTTWNRNGHSRSYQYARLGLDTKHLQFGLAANFDQYGPKAGHYSNFGFFIRSVF